MPHSLRAVVRRLRQASASANHGLTDAHLLDRFVRDRDGAAFEVLVWRHGPAVLGVCRRALGNPADADDAFQAVFLTLVRKAATVRRGDALAAWLCRIAFRISMRLRADRRRRAHADLAEVEAPPVPVADPDLRAALDAEIDRLPEAFRRAFVLCYLHGQTTAEAARTLGCPRGTVLSRLAAARKRLRRRLGRRGLAPAGLVAAIGAAWPSGELVAATVGLVKTFAAGGTVSRHIAALSQGVIRAMILSKVKLVAGVVLAVGVLGLGTGWLTQGPTAVADSQPVAKADPPNPAPPGAKPPKPAPPPDDQLDLRKHAVDAERMLAQKLTMQKQAQLLEAELRDLDRSAVQPTIAFRSMMIEIEEKARLLERLRAMHRLRELDGKIDDAAILANEQKHTSQIVELKRVLVKLEMENAVREREHAEKRAQLAANLHAVAEWVREREVGPARPERPADRGELERRIATLEREVADLRRELRRRASRE